LKVSTAPFVIADTLTSLPDNTRLPENGAKRGNKSGNGKNINPSTPVLSVLLCSPGVC